MSAWLRKRKSELSAVYQPGKGCSNILRCEKALKSYTKKAVQDYYTQKGFHKTACSPPFFLKSVQFFKYPSQVSFCPGELARRLRSASAIALVYIVYAYVE